MHLNGGLTSTATRAAGEENIIEFQRDLETKEMEELYHLIEKARKQLYVVEKEKGQNRKENELFIKRVRELKAYMKEHGLEFAASHLIRTATTTTSRTNSSKSWVPFLSMKP